ncbi:MAG TPA: ferrochelatase [Bryobacteraceae bacterium]|jgi:ferrochelatase|nr:ferrochelatase [Bryobacteraceae bacterium]
MPEFDALLVLSFGGPERREDVIPFLEIVLRGRNVPRERLLEVAEHYFHCGGRSPINDQNRELIAALRREFDANGLKLPVYWGNRNWHPFLVDALKQMRADGVRRALVFVTSAFGSYSGCRQYLEDMAAAQREAGENAPELFKLRGFFNHPGFIETMAERTRSALDQIPADERDEGRIVFTAHSLPVQMAASSPYVEQLSEACRLTAAAVGRAEWELAYQSRSGPPSQPWLEPDICAVLRRIASTGARHAVVVPIGFVSDHMEVIYDLDTEARRVAEEAGVRMIRAQTAGAHPRFVRMVRELVAERATNGQRAAMGLLGPAPDNCALDCCPRISPRRA